MRRFLPAGIHHILIGPDHLLFLVGLLLLGGTVRQLAVIVTSFTVAHSITLSLAALNLVSPPARIIEPAIALSIVYVGADNLLIRDGRDVRAWIAFAFGFIHGFGFANVLREMDLPARALGWSLFSFNVGVEIGQLLVVAVVATALAALRSRSEAAGRQLAFAGSIVVMAAGAFWFVQRVFFPGGDLHETRHRAWAMLLARSGGLVAVKAQPPAADAPKVIEVEKVKDNLYVLRGRRRQHRRLRHRERRRRRRREEPGLGHADPRQDQGADAEAGDDADQHAHARRPRQRQRGVPGDDRLRRAGEHQGQHGEDADLQGAQRRRHGRSGRSRTR